jgi:hypothetical protein
LVPGAPLGLGYAVEVTDDARVKVTKGEHTLTGTACEIEWASRGLAHQVLAQASLVKLRQRIVTSGLNVSRADGLGASGSRSKARAVHFGGASVHRLFMQRSGI